MNSGKHRLVSALVAVLFSSAALAGDPMLGMFSSNKGFGLSVETSRERAFNQYTAYVDMYGMFSARTDVPGFKVCFSHNYILHAIDRQECVFQFYAGPGCSAGYLHDYEKGHDDLLRNPGGMLSLSLTGGCRVPFKTSRLCLDISVRTEVGVHMRRSETLNTNSLSLYINGLAQTLAPQLMILYIF